MNRKFKRQVLDACETALVKRGFRRVRMHGVALDITADFKGWIGLCDGIYIDHVLITPSVGIHCIPLMRLVYALDEMSYKVSQVATFAYPARMVKRGVEPFVFRSEEDLTPEAERLASTIAQCTPFMRDFANYEAIASISKWRSEGLGGYPERAAVALYLMGRADEAKAWLDIQLQHFRLKERTTFEPFERFAAKLLHLIDTQDVLPLASGSSSPYFEERWKYLREA